MANSGQRSIMKHADNDMITQLLIRTKDQRPLPPPKQSQAVSEGIDEVSRIANELREARQEEAAAIACISFSAFEYMQTFIRPQLATDTQIEEWLHMLEEPRFFQACSRAIPELRWDQ